MPPCHHGRALINNMSHQKIIQRDEQFPCMAGAHTVRVARASLPSVGDMIVDDYEMSTSTGSSRRTYPGFETFVDALSREVDSFSFGSVSRRPHSQDSLAGVRVNASHAGTHITVYAVNDEAAAALLNAVRAAMPAEPVRAMAPNHQENIGIQLCVPDLHPLVASVAATLFDSRHYFEAQFEAFKSLESRVREMTRSDKSGVDLMGHAFRASNPLIDTATESGRSGTAQREGYLALFRGAMLAVRDPGAHMQARDLDPRDTLEYLAFASLLHRRLDAAREPELGALTGDVG